jgi:hypothetical protein
MKRLHTTHDKEKLKLFGDALANSASVDYQSGDKETYRGWLCHVVDLFAIKKQSNRFGVNARETAIRELEAPRAFSLRNLV